MRSRALLAGAAALALAGIAACGSNVTLGTAMAHAHDSDPTSLLGTWHVQAPGEESGATLRIADQLQLTRRCGDLSGEWRASASGLFIGTIYGWSMSCGTKRVTTPSWLQRAAGYRVDGSDRLLVDKDGSTTARLAPARGPAATLPPWQRKLLRAPAPVPAGLTPATPADLLRRWAPLDGKGHGKAFVEFDADGQYRGSDGCNGQGGRYLVGPAGELLATGGAQTLIGCNNSEAGSWVTEAARAALDGDRLVLLDPAGKELGRLRPAGSGAASGSP